MKKTYKGSCHCGKLSFEVDMDHVRVCDCTVCTKRGALNYRVEVERRLFENWKVEVEARFIINADKNPVLQNFKEDSFINVSLNRYF